MIEALISSTAVAVLVPLEEIEGETGEGHIALQACLMSQTLRKLAGIISKTGTLVIITNQLRQNIKSKYGSQELERKLDRYYFKRKCKSAYT